MKVLRPGLRALRALFMLRAARAGRARRSKPVPTENTYIERRLRDAMVVTGLGREFRQQYRFGRYRMDFAFPSVQLCVEADGLFWHTRPDVMEKDRRRDAYMKLRGWAILRFTGPQINKHPHQCAVIVRNHVRRMKAGWRPKGLQRPGGLPPPPPTPPRKVRSESVAFRTMNLLKARGVKVPGDLRLMADQGV